MAEQIIFYLLAAVIALFSVLAVTAKRIIRSAIYLLLVLLATAGLFLMINYHFLFTVQVSVYAGGIMIMFIMAIFLTHRPGEDMKRKAVGKINYPALLSIAGAAFCGCIIVNNVSRAYNYLKGGKIGMRDLGHAMLGIEKYQYLLPFEAISVLLLACVVGAIMIARKEKEKEKEK